MLTALYLAVAGLGGLLLLASVAAELVSPARASQARSNRPISANPSPEQLLACNQAVRDLLDQLGSVAGKLLSVPATTGEQELGSQWRGFTADWQRRWYATNSKCRFSELADSNLGIAFERMAQVHEDLDAMRLKYQGMLIRFEDEQAQELSAMRQALDRSHKALMKRVPAAR